ncbi:MAG: Trk system potassium transport protein TrkA [Bacteroidetes bacterium GWC2_33_15]|nr:MAG: Trk system potassium transport protein TrkA [Bacteroidetes bacterium GWA2_33_15]OFX52297.1 MAG: Trk system potassium transport protein TrkA [Bacteroidetes bacterium GWC2_33_15]OFX64451.1 MAG: Trk system potassium transport protein TrkA [Bacteroidetes bacterium GWB2_32_14]OFX67856.1 MAG: Trk system potassium transport protein TrkA [Bacteroidetes bacterium GWD2_33_33]HAN19475.1 Trk system potassium transporter TrkA [Bacteroidales bacterium]
MKIIIAGAGEVGTHLAKMLSVEFHDITVIDNDEKNIKNMNTNLDLMTITGSATSFEVLKDAYVKKADLFIAVAHSEEANILASMIAKKLGAKKTIARVDNYEYIEPENIAHFTGLGIDYLIYPERIAAREVVNLLGYEISEVVDFSGGKLSLYVLKLDKNAPVINSTLMDVTKQNKDIEFRAVAITRNGKTIIPRGHDSFMVNDLVYVVTNKSGFDDVMKYSGKKKLDVKNVMIVGGSRIGKRTAKMLEGRFNIKLIEKDKDKSYKLADYLKNTMVVNGDGSNIDLLTEEGLPKMDTFIAVTGNSETNILSCVLAKKMGVKKTIAEIENIDYIDLGESMGIDTIINKKLITASRIYKYTMSSEVESMKCLTGSDTEVLEFIAREGSLITKGKLRNIEFPKNAIVGGYIRDHKGFIAKGDTHIEADDRVVVFAIPSAIKKLDNFFNQVF